jgi:Ca-activated chloride channel family protein
MNGFMLLALPLLLLIALAGNAGPQAPVSIDPQAPGSHRISVDVNLVVLNATVRDQKGRPASNLGEHDFEVYEDGVRQALRLFLHEDIPVTVGLVIDHSGSMRPRLAEVIAAAQTFVQASSPQDEMFVVNFNETVSLGLPDAIRFTNRPDELARAISKAPVTGQTALYDAVLMAQVRLQTGTRDKKVLIVISDGGDNRSRHSLEEVVKMARQSSALIYTIGIFDDSDADRNPAVLRRLAGTTGGEAFFPGELNEVVPICERIARDIRNQYTLGYVPSSTAQPGAFRAIRVIARTAGKTNLTVRTRSGYIAGGESRTDRNEHAK